ncbi:SOH1 family protein [Wuchereria bancrofti]|uniref:tRNA:m(4)X modification enzyme TRM13 n=1 Tax=Wuchereria bancrofti TaxID=6293 RepID=J9EN47_WUCBA|nr:SOH1 family protein [Wuchereria bancrofti]
MFLYFEKENRKCRMLVRNGQKYCGEHAICDEQNKDRIICPNDPRHTVNKSQLQKHLSSRCNSRLPEVPWIVKNFNLAGSPNEVEPWYRPSNDGFLRIRKIVERIYNQIANDITDSFLKNDYVENCASKHLRIIDLLNNDKRWCMIDFGTGRAQLSYWMAKIAPKCRFLLIEKMGSRNKFDNKIHKFKLINFKIEELDLVFLKRLRCSVEHLDLSKIDLIRDVDNTAAVCKHFCGAATDFGIRCLMNGVKSGLNVHGFVLAPCCHHRTTYKEYIGRAFLEFHGICSSNEFAALRHISTWAVCSFLNQENLDGNVSVSSHSLKSENLGQQEAKLEFMSLSSVEKELLGQKAKAVLEFGRVVELRKFGYDVSLCRYVKRTVSPENLLIVGKKR